MKGNVNPGAVGERIAADYLSLRGYRVLERNFRIKHLEIDLIVRKCNCLSFVEVKTRRGNAFGEAVEAVMPWKISNLKRAARFFLAGAGCNLVYNEIRFDLVAIDLDLARDTLYLRHLKGIA